MALPKLVRFEGLNDYSSKWSYRILGKRCPNQREYFLSGAIVQAYKARQHLTTEYIVVEPLVEHTLQQVWLPKKKVS